jgi:hypothetical protein
MGDAESASSFPCDVIHCERRDPLLNSTIGYTAGLPALGSLHALPTRASNVTGGREMANTWEDAKKAAMQILGPKGKIPEPSKTIVKAVEESRDSWAEFEAARQSLKDALDTHQKKFDKYLGALRSEVDAINKDNLGLDPKNKEDAKKIAAARKPLVKYVNGMVQKHEGEFNDLKKLNAPVKTLMDAK